MTALKATTTVRDMIATYPQTFEVLLRHGMCEDCHADPPPVPLAHFAAKHCGRDIQGLLAELNRAIGR